MSLWYVEVREIGEPGALSLDLARHLHCRLLAGPVAILTERPAVFAATLGKRWTVVLHEIERAHSSTLRAARRRELARQVQYLSAATFTSQPASPAPPAQVHITDLSVAVSKECRTVYTTVRLSAQVFKRLVQRLPANGVLVMYGTWCEEYDEVVRELSQV